MCAETAVEHQLPRVGSMSVVCSVCMLWCCLTPARWFDSVAILWWVITEGMTVLLCSRRWQVNLAHAATSSQCVSRTSRCSMRWQVTAEQLYQTTVQRQVWSWIWFQSHGLLMWHGWACTVFVMYVHSFKVGCTVPASASSWRQETGEPASR